MHYILLGMAGFLVAYLFDWVSLRRIPYAKPMVGLIALGLGLYAHVMVCIQGSKFPLPPFLVGLGWLLAVLGSAALVYSLFLELPFRKTYAADGTSGELVTTGTYALVRHPGVPWYALLLVGLILASRSWLMLWAAPIWLAMDVLYVWLQERFYFNQMFPGYEQYRQETPMLIPNSSSIVRCWQTLRK